MTEDYFVGDSRLTLEQRIGAQIRHTRRAKGLTQDDLAARSGIDQGRISRYENAREGLSVGDLAAIARALRVSPTHLLEESPSDPEFMDQFEQLVPSLRRVLKKLALVLVEIQEQGLASATLHVQDDNTSFMAIDYAYIGEMDLLGRRMWSLIKKLGAEWDLHFDLSAVAQARKSYKVRISGAPAEE